MARALQRLIFQAAVQGLAQAGGAEGVDLDQGSNQAAVQVPEGGNEAMDDDGGAAGGGSTHLHASMMGVGLSCFQSTLFIGCFGSQSRSSSAAGPAAQIL